MRQPISFHTTMAKNIVEELNNLRLFVSVPRIALVTKADIALNGEPVDFVNNEVERSSINNLIDVYLPLSTIISIYHNGYDLYVQKKDDIMRIVETLSSILDRLEASHDPQALEVFNYINEFYSNVIEERKPTIERTLHRENNTNMIGFNDDYIAKDSEYIDLSDIVV